MPTFGSAARDTTWWSRSPTTAWESTTRRRRRRGTWVYGCSVTPCETSGVSSTSGRVPRAAPSSRRGSARTWSPADSMSRYSQGRITTLGYVTVPREEATPMIRVLLADDHEVIRYGLERLVSAQPDMEIAGMAVDGCEAVLMAELGHPDVILMDLEMP